MNDRLQQLYKDVILKHSESPVHYYKMESADHTIEAYNPFCGDHFHLYLSMNKEHIQAASFHGYGCAISKASTSLLVENMIGKSLDEVDSLYPSFRKIVFPEETPEPLLKLPEAFYAFEAAQKFPARKKCTLLCWDSLHAYIDNQGE